MGGILGYIGLTFVPKDLFLKIISLLAIFICVIYLFLHYCCLKPFPYTRQYDYDRPATYGKKCLYYENINYEKTVDVLTTSLSQQ